MTEAEDQLERWCVAARPQCDDGPRDLEAELIKARLIAHVRGADSPEPAGPSLGPFEVLRWLGRGGMGSVFEARDRAHGERLALKVLHQPDALGLARLRREFRSLADITHPNLVTLGELYEEPDSPFFTMELVPGSSLQQRLDGPGPWDAARIESCLRQLADALCALHARGIAHGDIKPSNLVLRPDGRLIVVDFGVAQVLSEPDQRQARRGSGTLAYMAPERVHGGRASPAADWYAVGAMLREWLACAAATGACSWGDARCQDLLRLAQELSQPDPARRLDARAWTRALGLPTFVPGGLVPEDDGVFVGRALELAALARASDSVAASGAAISCVVGEAGIGKSALLEQFAAAATAQGAWVLSGRCYEPEIARFKGFDGVIDGLASRLLQLSPAQRGALVPRDAASVLQVFPDLARAQLPCLAQRPHADPRTVRQAAFAGLAWLLRAVARERRLVIILDDWQWADRDGAALLEHLLLAAALPCLLVASYRPDAEAHGLAALARICERLPALELELGPIDDADAAQLVRALSGAALPAGMAREAGGSPLVLRALLRARPLPGGARDYNALVSDVLAELDSEARELLILAALAGRPLSAEVLGRAARLGARPWQALARLKKLRMLRSVAREGSAALALHHDRIREAVLSTLAADARRARHAALAQAAEQLDLGREAPEFVAEHHWRAGASLRAAHYAELAGDRARQAAGLEQACVQYGRALEAHAPARPAELVAKLADAAALVGDVQRAAPLLLEAAESLPARASDLQLRAAEMFLLAGRPSEGMHWLRPALRERGIWLPDSERAAALLGALELLRVPLAYRAARRALFDGSKPHGDPSVPSDPRIDMTFRLGFLFQLSLPMHGHRLLLWSNQRALRMGSRAQQARALALLAFTQNALGLGTESEHDALLARALEATASDPVEHTYALACKIAVGFARCDCPATLASTDMARRLVLEQRVPVDWLLGPFRAIEVSTQVLAGQFAELRAAKETVERECAALGNRAISVQLEFSQAWAELAAGHPQAVRQCTERAMHEWDGPVLRPLYGLAAWAEAHRRLYCGELDAAAALMREEKPRYVRSGLARVQAWSMALKLLWGTIALARSRAPDDAEARAAAHYMRALQRDRVRSAAPSAALLEAGLLRRHDAPAAARDAYVRARRGFEALGMQGYAAAAAYREAELAGTHARAPWFERQAIADPAAWTRMYAP